MAAKNIKFGMGGVFMPPVELNAQAVQRYEKSGIDFVAYWDQLCMTFPRSIWTPDIVPAAGRARMHSRLPTRCHRKW